MRQGVLAIIILFSSIQLSGQEFLSIREAIEIAIENNFGIKVSELEQVAAEMQIYKSNAGMGPTINWNANMNVSGSRVNQQFLDGRINNRWGRAISPNTNISLGMTIFDGGRMQAIYDQLILSAQLSEIEVRIVVQNIIEEVISAYYEVARQKETLEYLNNIITSYEERSKITEERWTVGRGSKLDFLQSNTELNAQKSERVRVTNNLKMQKLHSMGS